MPVGGRAEKSRAEKVKFRDGSTDTGPMDQMRDGGVAGRAARSFPGGQVRLPRLNEDRSKGPQIDMVDTAFIGGGTATVLKEEPSGFTGYYTYESLFDEPAEGDDDFRGESPYDVLRVTPTASWSEIVTAHRTLVKEFHPDRFVDHPAEVVAQAEVEIKRINRAYGELQQLRTSADRRTGGDRRQNPR